jgi:hypothetical protein
MAIALDLTRLEDRQALIQSIISENNKERKTISLRDVEVYNGRIHQYVHEHLSKRFDETSLQEMPIVSSINLARRVVDQEGSIYKAEPARSFTELSDDQTEKMDLIYRDMSANAKFLRSNRSFKLQGQSHVMVIPKEGKLIMRSLRNHHLDKIDDTTDPEQAAGYVISAFNKENLLDNERRNAGGGAGGGSVSQNRTERDPTRINTPIGDGADWQITVGSFTVWTKDLNFTMNEQGTITSGDDITNSIGVIPIVDISNEKDFEYWVRESSSNVDFTIEYNAFWSDTLQINAMQGYAQAYLIADDSIMPQSIQVGPNFILRLPTQEGSDQRPEFGFANPSPDMDGAIKVGESLLANFLSSKGQDTTLVSGSAQTAKFSSGVERLLSMIDKFEASKADMDVYRRAEMAVYNIIRAWHNKSIGTNLLEKKYVSTTIHEDSEVAPDFAGPEMIQSEEERITNWRSKIEDGLASRVDAIMDLESIDTRDRAIERLAEIDKDEMDFLGGSDANKPDESNEDINFGPGRAEPIRESEA